MSPVVVAGLVAPVAVLVLAALVGAAVRGRVGRSAVLAVGLGAIIGVHLWQVHRLDALGRRGARRAGSRRRGGAWGLAFSALYRRVRTRTLHHRDLATTIERFRNAVEALPDGMVIVDAANRISGRTRGRRRTSASTSRRTPAGRCST